MGWLTHEVGWSHVFFFMGGLGIVISFVWLKVIHDPNNHPCVNQKELDYIAEGGALINMDQKSSAQKVPFSVKMGQIKQLIGSRMMVGIYIGQYCINALTYFFITRFPVYLVQARGMSILKAGFVASIPAVCGFVGGVLGGIISDWLMRRTGSLNIARKTPIVLGMLLSMTMLMCNYVNAEWMIIGFMAMAFFGKGIGALGWAVMADTAPKEISGPVRRSVQHVRQYFRHRHPYRYRLYRRHHRLFQRRADLRRYPRSGGGIQLPGAGWRYQTYRT